MAWTGKNRRGKTVTLLTPSEKANKFYREKKAGVRMTNNGEIKKDKPLTNEGKAYRDGYLASQRDNARAYRSKHPRYEAKSEAGRIAKSKRDAYKAKKK